ncbi:meckelin-like [Mytilus galloprovincialis]|uniref:meckelin-like n=1 Tax=Mytilus galloprovincialis TaxID=29158 RepID=UPI003F7C41EE
MEDKCAKLILLLNIFVVVRCQSQYKAFENITDCKETGLFFQYYQTSSLKCLTCPENSTSMTVSSDGLDCICNPGYYYTRNFGGGKVTCAKCPANQARSADGWGCVDCGTLGIVNGECLTCGTRITPVERELNGNLYLNVGTNQRERDCRPCQDNTWLNSAGTRCVRCTDYLKTAVGLTTCTCIDAQKADGLCLPSLPTLTNVLTTVPLTDGFAPQFSALLDKQLKASYLMCQENKNETACQTLGNMCALTFFEYEDTSQLTSACNLYKNIIRVNLADWKNFLPDMYFTRDGLVAQDGDRVLDDESITTTYTFDPPMNIKILAASYTQNGEFLGIDSVLGGKIQLCSDTTTRLNAAFVFGTYYSHSCSIPAIDLWDQTKYKPEFYDLFLDFELGDGRQIYPVPIKLNDYLHNRQNVNQESDSKDWHLVKRFFLVDNIATTGAATTAGAQPEYVRYVKSISMNLKLVGSTSTGQIFPPYISITYGTVSLVDAQQGASISTSFSVDYEYSTSKYRRDFQISVGTLSTLSIIYAGYRTWVWSKRAGKPAIDFQTIINFLFFASGSLANIFFVITFGIAFYFLTFFKGQNTVFLFHITGLAEREWLALFGSGFALKCLQMAHMIIMQCTADVFLIDWERPKHVVATSEKKTGSNVSIWRTYFVANEWNEIQTLRKINQIFQIFAVIFFLNVVGFENVATKDPDGRIIKDTTSYRAEDSTMFRYAIGASVYILVALCQWIFFTLIYERFVEDKVRQFVDLCSMSNISVFVMAHAQFGYYVHGKSVHGKADTNMGDMFDMMRREEEDLCGKRGLLPDTDQQTFMMALPRKLRVKYETVMLPVALEGSGAVGGAGKSKETIINTKTNAYNVVNKFLAGFVDHSLKEIDYVVKDKTLLESIMDTEFLDASEKGIFYNDDGHSFDRALFYGNESALVVFDTLLFCIIDLIFQNFVLAGVLTYLITELIAMARDSGGRMNLAKKTLVDQRFLI